MTGKTIAQYRVLEKIGEGGMGSVWKAEDIKLKRLAALKFVSAADMGEELRDRLLREAQATASIDHPRICPVYSIHDDEGEPFIAMAFVDGPTLADKIRERPLPLDEAVEIAIQIAEGLQEAHEHDVVHRDIKPSNVMLDRRGQVKIMDFGLALLTNRSRITKTASQMGTTLYMAPEQIAGEQVDRRADIWALGCVLYEMLTQKAPFEEDYEQAIAFSILNETQEPVTALRSDVSTRVDEILAKALAKDPAERYQHADEMIVDLRALRKPSGATRLALATDPRQPAQPSKLPWALAGTMALAAAGLAAMYFGQQPTERRVEKWSFSPPGLPDKVSFAEGIAISPDGRHIVYEGEQSSLWVRDLDEWQPRRLERTEGAKRPFWSPDSRYIGFSLGREVMKIALDGGPPITVCESPGTLFGGAWSPDGSTILFNAAPDRYARIFEAPAEGGKPTLIFGGIETDKATHLAIRAYLPSGAGDRSVILRVGGGGRGSIVVQDLDSGERTVLAEGDFAAYSPTGHIVYSREGDLWALPFSLDTLGPTGESFPILQSAGSPSVSDDGTLVSHGSPNIGLEELVWRNRAGNKLGVIGQPQIRVGFLALSPDDEYVAVSSTASGSYEVWIHEVARPLKRLLPSSDLSTRPVWTPSGEEITYQSGLGADLDIYQRSADGSGEPRRLFGTEAVDRPYGWSRDGRFFLYTVAVGDESDIWYLRRDERGEFEPFEFLDTPAHERGLALSPDSRFLAYCSDQSGRGEVYVREFPSATGQVQVSTNGGCQPRWSHDGSELFYVEGKSLMAAQVTSTNPFKTTIPVQLFTDRDLNENGDFSYDVSTDGRFLMTAPHRPEGAGPPSIQVWHNWYEEFRTREQD